MSTPIPLRGGLHLCNIRHINKGQYQQKEFFPGGSHVTRVVPHHLTSPPLPSPCTAPTLTPGRHPKAELASCRLGKRSGALPPPPTAAPATTGTRSILHPHPSRQQPHPVPLGSQELERRPDVLRGLRPSPDGCATAAQDP